VSTDFQWAQPQAGCGAAVCRGRESLELFCICEQERTLGEASQISELTDTMHIIKPAGQVQRHALYSEAILNFAKTPGFEPERRPRVRDGAGVGRGQVCIVVIVS
jgi:hypothetical protein